MLEQSTFRMENYLFPLVDAVPESKLNFIPAKLLDRQPDIFGDTLTSKVFTYTDTSNTIPTDNVFQYNDIRTAQWNDLSCYGHRVVGLMNAFHTSGIVGPNKDTRIVFYRDPFNTLGSTPLYTDGCTGLPFFSFENLQLYQRHSLTPEQFQKMRKSLVFATGGQFSIEKMKQLANISYVGVPESLVQLFTKVVKSTILISAKRTELSTTSDLLKQQKRTEFQISRLRKRIAILTNHKDENTRANLLSSTFNDHQLAREAADHELELSTVFGDDYYELDGDVKLFRDMLDVLEDCPSRNRTHTKADLDLYVSSLHSALQDAQHSLDRLNAVLPVDAFEKLSRQKEELNDYEKRAFHSFQPLLKEFKYAREQIVASEVTFECLHDCDADRRIRQKEDHLNSLFFYYLFGVRAQFLSNDESFEILKGEYEEYFAYDVMAEFAMFPTISPFELYRYPKLLTQRLSFESLDVLFDDSYVRSIPSRQIIFLMSTVSELLNIADAFASEGQLMTFGDLSADAFLQFIEKYMGDYERAYTVCNSASTAVLSTKRRFSLSKTVPTMNSELLHCISKSFPHFNDNLIKNFKFSLCDLSDNGLFSVCDVSAVDVPGADDHMVSPSFSLNYVHQVSHLQQEFVKRLSPPTIEPLRSSLVNFYALLSAAFSQANQPNFSLKLRRWEYFSSLQLVDREIGDFDMHATLLF